MLYIKVYYCLLACNERLSHMFGLYSHKTNKFKLVKNQEYYIVQVEGHQS